MFQLTERLSTTGSTRPGTRRYVKRALLFGSGLLLLWVALQLFPVRTGDGAHAVFSDRTGTVAAQAADEVEPDAPALFSPGTLAAVLLLGGGVALAVYLRRRNADGDAPAPITPLGEYSIGPGQSLRLVECGEEVLLLGVTSGRIELLRSYPAGHFETIRSDDSPPPAGSHFADVFRQVAGRRAQVATNGTTC